MHDTLKHLMRNSIYRLPIGSLEKKIDHDSVIRTFMKDFHRYYIDEFAEINHILNEPTLIGILCYRVARELYEHGDESSALVISNLGRFYSGVELYYTAKIGHSFKINHGVGTVVGARSIIGNNVLLHHNVTIGAIDRKTPILDDNVIVYPGAKILGGIKIGSNVVVGANAIVIDNVPPNSTIVSSLSRIL